MKPSDWLKQCGFEAEKIRQMGFELPGKKEETPKSS
jgi:hypothetical protein